MAGNEIASIELPAPAGWKKFIPKNGAPKRNGIIFISPTGEEIRNRKHMDQFLRSHPGGPSPSEFDWGYGDQPRRSVRIREKFKAAEFPDEDLPVKKQRKKLNSGKKKQEMNGEDAEVQEEQGEAKQESNGEDIEEQEEESDGNQELNGEETKKQEEQVDEVLEGKKTDSKAVESILVDAVMEEGEGNQVSEGKKTESQVFESTIVDGVMEQGEGKQGSYIEDAEEQEERGEEQRDDDGEDTKEQERHGEGNQEMNGEDTEEQEEQTDEVLAGLKADSIAIESIIVDAVTKDIKDGSAEAKEENNFTEFVAEDKTTEERLVKVEDADQHSGEMKILEVKTSKNLPFLSPPEAAEEDNSVLRESKEKLEVESVPEEKSAAKEIQIQVASEVTPHETESN